MTFHIEDVRGLYDRVAPRYELFRRIWLKLAGGRTERALLQELAPLLLPRCRVVDAGSGTGFLSREILRLAPSVRLVSLDQSLQMLRGSGKRGAPCIQASVLALPFPEGSFDIVVSDWVLETVPERDTAVGEYLRILVPGGRMLYTFCSFPKEKRWRSALLRAVVRWGFAGRFLTEGETPLPRTRTVSVRRFYGGLSSLVVGRKDTGTRELR